jgi:hypothetical protein
MDLAEIPTEELMRMRQAPAVDLSSMSTEELMKLKADAPAEMPMANRSALERGARQVGLTVRAGAKGLVSIPAMLGDAIGMNSSGSVDRLLDAVGLPKPATPVERVAGDVASGMAGSGVTAGGAAALRPISEFGRNLAGTFAQGPAMQVVSGGTGPGAASVAREKGASPIAQFFWGLLGGAAPALATAGGSAAVRGVARGGEEGRARTAENVKTFEEAGTTPTVGQATENRSMRLAETMMGKTPGSAGVFADKAKTQAGELSDSVQGLADGLSTNTGATPAGRAIKEGVVGDKGFRDYFKARQEKLYDTLDQHIAPSSRVDIANTRTALEALNADIPGAPNTSKFFRNSRIAGIEDALKADTETSAGATLKAARCCRRCSSRCRRPSAPRH